MNVIYVLYEKRPVMGRFKPVFDGSLQMLPDTMVGYTYLTESIVVDKMYVSRKININTFINKNNIRINDKSLRNCLIFRTFIS